MPHCCMEGLELHPSGQPCLACQCATCLHKHSYSRSCGNDNSPECPPRLSKGQWASTEQPQKKEHLEQAVLPVIQNGR
jgi:hypothetical protein